MGNMSRLSLAGAQEMKTEFDIDVRVLGIAGSKNMVLSEDAIDLANWQDTYQQ